MSFKKLFNCKANTGSTWFSHVVQGDLEYVKKNILEFKRTYQSEHIDKQGNQNVERFPGWAAIHIAAYYHYYEMFEFLFEYEFDLLTDRGIYVQSTDMNEPFAIMGGSTIIHILIVANNPKMIQWVLNKMETNEEYKQLAGIKNDTGYVALLYGAILGNNAAEKWLCNMVVLSREIKCLNIQKQSIIHLIAYAGNRKYAQLLNGLITQTGPIYLPDEFVAQLKPILKCFFEMEDIHHLNWLVTWGNLRQSLEDMKDTNIKENGADAGMINNFFKRSTEPEHDQCRIEMVQLYENLQ